MKTLPENYIERVEAHCTSERWQSELVDALWATQFHRVQRVLDYGCGTGRLIPAIAQILKTPLLNSMGYDPNPQMVKMSRANDMMHRYTDHFDECRSKSFDLVVFSHSLAHAKYPSRELHKAVSVLKPGTGQLLILTNNKWHKKLRYVDNLMSGYGYDSTVYRDWTKRELHTWLTVKSCGYLNGIRTWVGGETVPGLSMLGDFTKLRLYALATRAWAL